MEVYMELKRMLEDELEEIIRKGEITASNIDAIDKLTHSLKNTNKIIEDDMGGYSGEEYSGRRYYRNGNAYDDGGDSYGRYSGRRHRDSMGRYARADGSVRSKLREMMMDASLPPEDKKILERAMDELNG